MWDPPFNRILQPLPPQGFFSFPLTSNTTLAKSWTHYSLFFSWITARFFPQCRCPSGRHFFPKVDASGKRRPLRQQLAVRVKIRKQLAATKFRNGIVFFFFKVFFLKIYFIILFFGCVGSSLLCAGFSLVAVSGGFSSLQ